MTTPPPPTLWRIHISHYSEKVRWALDHKDVEHRRRAPMPPSHMPIALAATRGRSKTFPLWHVDGRWIGDSTTIIADLEERYPDPPLYPNDAKDRARALELEEWFDEELGPHVRLLLFYETTHDQERLEELAVERIAAGPLKKMRGVAAYSVKRFARLRYSVEQDGAVGRARTKVLEALDRLEHELDGRDHLVGDTFTVADLTAAALFYPLVTPPGAPTLTATPPQAIEEFRAPLAQRVGYRWVERTYARYR